MKKISTLLLGFMLMASAGFCVPMASDGFIAMGGDSTTLTFEFSGATLNYSNYTIGVFDMSTMTAGVDDPDFQVQALQADRVILLHEAGQNMPASCELTVNSGAQLGMFIIQDATLAEFSRGLNPYRPIFSVAGTPGSYLVELQDSLDDDSMQFVFNSMTTGMLMATGLGATGASNPLCVSVYQTDMPVQCPVVPEPASMALVGLGISMLGCVAHRRRKEGRVR